MRRSLTPLIAASFVAAAVALYWPALALELMGDDYQWVQHAHRAMHAPWLLLADLDTFYRPASTWTLAADHLLWGFRPAGFHLTNVALQGLAAAVLALAARRLGMPLAAALAAGALWLATPLTSEPAIAVAIRFEDLLLLAWLALILGWPKREETWTRGRIAAVAGATVLAAASKETWVVTFILVLALELGARGARPVAAAWHCLPFLGAAALYAAAYFLAFPSGKGYFVTTFAPLAKLPHMLAAFLQLTSLVPLQFPFTWREAIAFALTLAAAVWAVRRRSPAGLVGVALLAAPVLPTLLVPYLPTRYTAIPFAGFLLLAISTAVEGVDRGSARSRRLFAAGGWSIVALVLVAGAIGVRVELLDAARISLVHARLLAEAGVVAPTLPAGTPVAVVRAETENPLGEIARTPRGLFKLYFPRQRDPYGLVDAAALFEWAIARESVLVRRWDDGAVRFAGRRGTVLLHEAGRFVWAVRDSPDIVGEARRWSDQGMPVRWILREQAD